MRRVIFNQKGGVGKTTITCNLAAISAASGLRTLVLDLDPQANTSQYLLGGALESLEATAADFFEEMLAIWPRKEIQDCISPTPFYGLDLLPAHPALGELQDRLESRYKMYKLKEALGGIDKEYDEIFVDTPPAMGFYTRCALIAADSCLIPFDCDDFSRRALYGLLDSVRELQQDHNPQLVVEGIIVNQFQARAKLPKKLVSELVAEGLPVLQPCLSASVKIRESHEKSTPMIHLFAKHKVTAQYRQLYETIAAGGGSEARPNRADGVVTPLAASG